MGPRPGGEAQGLVVHSVAPGVVAASTRRLWRVAGGKVRCLTCPGLPRGQEPASVRKRMPKAPGMERKGSTWGVTVVSGAAGQAELGPRDGGRVKTG